MTRRGELEVPRFEIVYLNDSLRQVREALDTIEGVKGDFTRLRWTLKEKALEYKDINDTVIHGFGDV